ncbi:glycoside hydrolase family 15 protein [Agromyces aurantiacus]|uniref:Glycoside hydrolase family 15 protein n=1 Tax=Agromyces aurantiacus TaxID=165814 RepID=A0ABV9R3I2_9MICO|nr:glycoside hydrolase family 15 protein [Agromyces aurantiacus]MBM7506111.1 GH15 family glucan-1,4-alpha-glucosidase [Agromyces aurantiacus]
MTLPLTARHEIAALAASSADLIASLQDDCGAYPASPTFSAYAGYSWFRDGAFIADGMSSAGRADSAERFFDWCARVLEARRADIEAIVAAARAGAPVPDSAMLPTRFTFDGRAGDDEWWDFQLDGYGTWVWAVGEHVRRHGTDPARWAGAVALSVDYLASSWSRPCFDWWEEHAEHVHVSSLGCLAGGLRAAAGLGVLDDERAALAAATADEIVAFVLARGATDGHLAKWVGSSAVDASLAAIVGLMDVVPAGSPLGRGTIAAIERDLAVDGGVHRYLGDTYFGGGQWPLLSCFLGLAHARAGERERALELLEWAASTAGPDGSMPEQVERHLLDPTRVDEWVERWGPSADPLLWSHAMFIRLAVELDGTASDRTASDRAASEESAR